MQNTNMSGAGTTESGETRGDRNSSTAKVLESTPLLRDTHGGTLQKHFDVTWCDTLEDARAQHSCRTPLWHTAAETTCVGRSDAAYETLFQDTVELHSRRRL